MQRLLRFGVLATVIALSIIGSGAIASARTSHGDTVGHVYVNNNTAGINSISGFDRHADGTLTPIAGSPFDIGGAGTGAATGCAGTAPAADRLTHWPDDDRRRTPTGECRLCHPVCLAGVRAWPVLVGGRG